MSCLSPSAFKDGRSEPAGQGALVPTRGGHFVTSGARFALALLEGRPVTILMDGPAAGTQARLSKTGLGRLGSIWDRTFDDGSDESDADRPGVADRGRGHDLAEGEARLRDVMQTILEDSRPQILAQIARDAPGQRSARLNGITVPVLERRICRTKDDCLDGLAPVLEGGQLCKPPPNWAGRVDFLTAGLGSELRGKMTKGRPVAHLVLAPPGRGKTRSAQRLIEALPGEAVVWVFQPTLRKAHQFAQDMAASARPIRVFRGRGAPVAEGGARASARGTGLAPRSQRRAFRSRGCCAASMTNPRGHLFEARDLRLSEADQATATLAEPAAPNPQIKPSPDLARSARPPASLRLGGAGERSALFDDIRVAFRPRWMSD